MANTVELVFPLGGVQRRTSARVSDKTTVPTAAWAVNVQAEGPIDRRIRGGSRTGLTKLVDHDFGTTIADMVSMNVSRGDGTREILVILSDSSLSVIDGGDVTSPVAYLTNASGDRLTTPAGDLIVVSSRDAPANGFLVAGQQHVFAITQSGIVKMDPVSGQVDDVMASAGSIPTQCTFGVVYRDRLILSGQDNAIYASATGRYDDWDFGTHFETTTRAVVFQLALANEVGDLPTAMIAHKDDFLICATKRSLWVLRGDPATGQLIRVSEHVGIVDARAWCRTDDAVVFLAEDGLYSVNADGTGLKPLTPQKIPEELREIDTDTVTVSIGYDHQRLAYHIYLRTTAGSDTHFIYEQQLEAFWPIRLTNDHTPRIVCRHRGNLVLAGNDGNIRKVDGADDDGQSIDSHLLIGPVKLGSLNFFGIVNTLHGVLANDSGNVTWRLIVGDSAEVVTDSGKSAIEAFQSGSDFSSLIRSVGTWSAGRSRTSRPRARGLWACVWIQSTNQWALEGVTMQVNSAGAWR
ncbi:MAG: hypothetical protein AAF745_00195 [Planctomycetota bacterium]